MIQRLTIQQTPPYKAAPTHSAINFGWTNQRGMVWGICGFEKVGGVVQDWPTHRVTQWEGGFLICLIILESFHKQRVWLADVQKIMVESSMVQTHGQTFSNVRQGLSLVTVNRSRICVFDMKLNFILYCRLPDCSCLPRFFLSHWFVVAWQLKLGNEKQHELLLFWTLVVRECKTVGGWIWISSYI
jgi:hypothetical protein